MTLDAFETTNHAVRMLDDLCKHSEDQDIEMSLSSCIVGLGQARHNSNDWD